jgi:hypothetical protein
LFTRSQYGRTDCGKRLVHLSCDKIVQRMLISQLSLAIQGIGSGIIQNLTTIVVADIVSLRERGFYSSLTGMYVSPEPQKYSARIDSSR